MFTEPSTQGQVIKRDITDDYVKHALSFIDVSRIRPLKVVIDAGNGMAGMIMPKSSSISPASLSHSILN